MLVESKDAESKEYTGTMDKETDCKSCVDFQLHRGSAPLYSPHPAVFKVPLYFLLAQDTPPLPCYCNLGDR